MHNTRAVIIAAGLGSRLRPLTLELPKCMLQVGNKPLIQHCIDNFHANAINSISVVTGYKSEKINFDGLHYYHNDNYANNNILHSLMYAREELEKAIEDQVSLVISYSDIWFHPSVIKTLLQSKEDINVVVDTHWMSAYEGRTDHPISEAELAVFSKDNKLCAVGKNIINHYDDENENENENGEFIGLLMMSPIGIKNFLDHFDKVNNSLSLTSSFQKATEWQKSYITDILQDMIDTQISVNCVNIQSKNKWKEFDTRQDFERGLPL